MTSERFKELCGAVDWDAVPAPVSFDDWLADFVPDKRLRDKMDDGRITKTRARFEIIAERNGVELATVIWAILARCMGFGIFASNGVPIILQDTDVESFAEKINGYLYRPDFLRFLIDCYADTPEHAQAHAQQVIILQERIAELDEVIEQGRFAL